MIRQAPQLHKLPEAKLDKLIEQAFIMYGGGVQISILDIDKLFTRARLQILERQSAFKPMHIAETVLKVLNEYRADRA